MPQTPLWTASFATGSPRDWRLMAAFGRTSAKRLAAAPGAPPRAVAKAKVAAHRHGCGETLPLPIEP